MRYVYLSLICLLLTGCSMFPNVKWPEQWKSLANGSTGSVVAAQKVNENVKQITDADKKVEEARKKMELDYAKFREDLQKVYDDKTKKDKAKNATKDNTEYCIDPVRDISIPKINIPNTIAIFSVTS